MSNLPKPLVTVVIPCFDYAQVVGRAIGSVKAQTISNFECFVVNDGSTDDSEHVIRDAIKDDARFHYIYQNNSGVAEARNAGVFAGVGKYVCALDADDQIAPLFLEACVKALEEDPTIGIAYTGLYYYKADGTEGLSPWPGEWDYDKFLKGQNQIPTCNVARREIWERLGGQRQRYCPQGAGEEDAEFLLRAGAYGFKGKKVTNAGLFLYSWQTGRVSGNRQHRITDWRGWHPWVQDNAHPLASYATPVRLSHPVRQYDQPFVSVVIPVGPGHERYVETALDSLEAQTFRNWEVVVVRDSDQNSEVFERTMRAYPYAKRVDTGGNRGAGYARNRGVEKAKAPMILYLDADDWLLPNAIDRMLDVWGQNRAAVYGDYIGKAIISPESLPKFKDKLLAYDDKYSIATILNQVKEYDCEAAKAQPMQDMYIWALVSTLFPKAWHYEIGGFDESMKTWEDWDYWIRMAREGKCFVRIPEPLIVYRFYSGGRRDSALADGSILAQDLIPYLRKKYEGTETKMCNCSNNKPRPVASPMSSPRSATAVPEPASDDQYLMCVYSHPSLGQHRVFGQGHVPKIDYGYRGQGEKFLVHVKDIAVQPNLFVPINESPPEQPPAKQIPVGDGDKKFGGMEPPHIPVQKDETEPVKIEVGNTDLVGIPWVSHEIASRLNAIGVHTRQELANLSLETLAGIKNVGKGRAPKIQRYARENP